MLTTHELIEFGKSLATRRVLSVYVGGIAGDPAACRAWRAELARAFTVLRRELRKWTRAEEAECERCMDHVDTLLGGIGGAIGGGSWVAFATADGIVHTTAIEASVPTLVRWSEGPWISPYLAAQRARHPMLVVQIDARSARIYRYLEGQLQRLEVLRTRSHVEPAYHMGATAREHFHPGTRGSTATDAAARAQRAATDRLAADVVDRLGRLADGDEPILIGGSTACAHTVFRMLPTHLQERSSVVDALNAAVPGPEVRSIAAARAAELEREWDASLVEAAEAGAVTGGKGVTQTVETRSALVVGAVHTLLLTEEFLRRSPDAAEEMVRAAIARRARVSVISGTAADRLEQDGGGVGAVLRFRPPLAAIVAAGGAP